MASIFEVIQGLEVTNEDIAEAELFSEQYLSSTFPTYDFRQGTAIRDMTVRPNATLLALVQKAIKYYFDESDIINITNNTDSDIVDKRLSNFFISRKEGDKATIKARLYFSFPTQQPQDVIVPASAFFSTDNEVKYFPKGNITVCSSETPGNYYFKYDGSSSMHYVDLELDSINNEVAANLVEGDLLYFTVFSPYFLKANIQYLVKKAIPTESNEDMVGRAYTSISTRNLINDPSIVSHILDNYNYVSDVFPVGLGDEWMYRDLVSVLGAGDSTEKYDYHAGGHVDIYVDTELSTSTVQLTAMESAKDPSKGVFVINGPIVEFKRSSNIPSNVESDTIQMGEPYSYDSPLVSAYTNYIPESPKSDIGLSANHTVVIRDNDPLFPIVPGDTATFEFKSFTGVSSVNQGINSTESRVVCANYLTRSFVPIFIDIDLDTRGKVVQDKVAPIDGIDKYLKSIPNGGAMYVSEIINILIDSGIKDFKLPISVKCSKYPRNISGTNVSQDGIEVTEVVDHMDALDIQKFYLRDITYTEDKVL